MKYKRADRRDYLKPIDTSNIWVEDQTQNLCLFADNLEHQIFVDDDNYVLCINGAWGTGKTFFIRRWEASLEKKGYDVIYFNAWENDCGEDPLVSLATLIYKKTRDLLILKEFLGHNSLSATEIYLHIANKKIKDAKGILC